MSNEEYIEVKDRLGFDDIFSGGKVKQIKWGDEFNEWPVDRQLNYAKQLASAMNKAADEMQQDRDRHLEARKLAEKQREEAYQARDIAKETLQQNITESNAEIHQLQQLVGDLQLKLKRLGG